MTSSRPLDSARAAGVRSFDQGRCLAAGQWRFDWAFASGDPAFEGHFPHQPILPAVFLMEMAQRAAEFALHHSQGQAHALCRVERFRFSQPVLPGDACSLVIEWVPADEGLARVPVRASFTKPGARVAQGTLVLAPEPVHAC